MDENVVRKFSVNARIKLRKSVESSMARLGVGPGHEPESIDSSGTTTILNLPGGLRTMLDVNEADWRKRLMEQVSKEGYDNVVERVAYTWFNRIIAIRYMEVNDFLPIHVRVLSSVDEGKIEPDIVTQCIHVADAFGLSSTQKEEIIALKEEGQSDRLFSRMFIHECNSLSKILPELFTRTESYERLLLDLSYTVKDGVIRELVDTVPEEDFRDAVQIIGWMYQYYNTELKDQVFDKKRNTKISKEQIPAATQLFTPDWIVRYMVENSLGRVWLEGHPDDSLQSKWRYYLEEAEQEPKVAEELEKLRASRRRMEPVDIKIIDPCMGSGHILVYAFDVLIQIYDSYGYSRQDAAQLIIENNLFGLDIDERAYQLAYFAVMMKARSYDPNIFAKSPKPNLHAMVETSGMDIARLGAFGNGMDPMERSLALSDMRYLFDLFKEAKTYGSLIKVRELDYDRMYAFLKARPIDFDVNDRILGKIVAVAGILSQKYDAVITNPPYMGSSGMIPTLSEFVKDQYPLSKLDLSTCFMERALDLSKEGGFSSMINIPVWMFTSSFEKLRKHLSETKTYINMAHQGRGIFGSDFGSTAFVVENQAIPDYISTFIKLYDKQGAVEPIDVKESKFLSGRNRFFIKQSKFNMIPGAPIAYWISDNEINAFSNKTLSEIGTTRKGMYTGLNEVFVREWYEVKIDDIFFNATRELSLESDKKWYPYSNGGKYRKWYGNNSSVVLWEHDGFRLRTERNSEGKVRAGAFNLEFIFKEGIVWNSITSSDTSMRYQPTGFLFSSASNGWFGPNVKYVLGFLCSSIFNVFSNIINPSLNKNAGDIGRIPLILDKEAEEEVCVIVDDCISLSKSEWDMHEISWDFKRDPLIISNKDGTIQTAYDNFKHEADTIIKLIEKREYDLNGLFIRIYGLQQKEVSAVVGKPIMINLLSCEQALDNLLSFAVGCMFGRYSIDKEGLINAGGEWKDVGQSFEADKDNIIPICDNEYFGDDIVTRFVEFIRVAFGEEHLEENLRYIADNLGIEYMGTSRDGIRHYFLKKFYDNHVKMYQKCPIYWLFDSGEENGFKALIYMHRYTPDLISKMRQDYFLPMLSRYRGRLESAEGTERIELQKKIEEIQVYDIALERYASEKVSIDLDDGVKVNYAKFQNIENPGSKKRIDLLHPLK